MAMKAKKVIPTTSGGHLIVRTCFLDLVNVGVQGLKWKWVPDLALEAKNK